MIVLCIVFVVLLLVSIDWFLISDGFVIVVWVGMMMVVVVLVGLIMVLLLLLFLLL